MSNYAFKALDADGIVIRGILEADTISSVHENLAAKGLFVLHVRESSLILKKISDRFITWRITRKDIIEFSSNLSIMVRAGVPILSALDDIIDTIDNQQLKSTVRDIKKNIEMGTRLSDACRGRNRTFGRKPF
jgi:type II secretory pathway component PulF